MNYIQIPKEHNAKGFYVLIRQSALLGPIQCFPQDTYLVNADHMEMLKQHKIPFTILSSQHLSIQTP